MKSILKLVISRDFRSIGFIVAIILGCVLSVAHVLHEVYPLAFSDAHLLSRLAVKGSPPSLFTSWIGITWRSDIARKFYFLFPLLACMPHQYSLRVDMCQEQRFQSKPRMEKIKYLVASMIAAALSAATVVLVPLVLNIVLTMCLIPQIQQLSLDISQTIGIGAATMFGDVFYSKPWAYIAIFLGMNCLIAATFSLMSCAAAIFRRPVISLVLPLVFCQTLQVITQNSELAGFTPINMLLLGQPHPSIFLVDLLCIGITLAICISIVLCNGLRNRNLHRKQFVRVRKY